MWEGGWCVRVLVQGVEIDERGRCALKESRKKNKRGEKRAGVRESLGRVCAMGRKKKRRNVETIFVVGKRKNRFF